MSNSPTFVAHFADGETVRMTVFTPLEKLDLGRGVRLAYHAYRSRRKRRRVPEMISASFVRRGALLQTYCAAELKEAAKPPGK